MADTKKNANNPLPFDEEKYPFGVAPGGNKFGLLACPFCGRPATETGRNDMPVAHLFTDELSAQEYRISGLCQECMDRVFQEPEEEA